jgi:hypothetical protein
MSAKENPQTPPSRQLVRPREVRDSLLKPILNMGRFFVGPTIPIVSDPVAINARVKDIKARGLPLSSAAEGVLTRVLMLLVKRRDASDEQRQAMGLMAGLVLLVAEDDYFYIPETTEHASDEKLEALAFELAQTHGERNRQLAEAVASHGLLVGGTADVSALRSRYSQNPELQRVLGRIAVQLGQGHTLLERQQDPARRAAHQARFGQACQRVSNLIARLLLIPPDRDHARLRRRLIARELEQIEIDALGAAQVSDKEQTAEAARLLAATGIVEAEDQTAGVSAEEVAAKLAAIAAEAKNEGAQDDAAEDEEEEEDGWFFDMD